MLNIKKFITLIIYFGFTLVVSAQLVTSNSQTPTQLVEDVLVGNGVSVSNVTYIGHSEAIGSFDGSNTNLGLDSGILLTTGTVLNTAGGGIFSSQEGPHGPNNTASAGTDNGTPGYAPLTDIANEDTENAAILEFDFIPQSDTVRFKYVFGSEEYLEFVDAGFNDVFAFFISGPGFGGTVNMATIPGTGGTPVTIDNVNDNVNSAFYVDNGDGSSAPQNGSDFYIQYDGFTVVIEAVAKVQCGETYHLKIAIADVGDGSYDSGIFLEASSLASYAPLVVNATTTLDLPNNMIAEGCETATVTVTRDINSANSTLTIPIIVSGTATEGVDYGNIPPSVTFAPGQTTVTFTFDVFSDNLVEGNETIIIEFNHPDPCGNDNFVSTDLIIFDVEPLTITIPEQNIHCPGEEATLVPVVTGGVSNYTYSWNTGETTLELSASPSVTTNYTLTVTDVCLPNPLSEVGTITVPVYPPISIISTPDTAVLCPNTPVLLASEASGGANDFIYQWTESGNVISNTATYLASPLETTTYTVLVTDGCGVTSQKDIIFTVLTPLLTIEMSPDQLMCPGDSTNIWVEAAGGLGDFTYNWHHSNETTATVQVKPQHSTIYTVSVEDGCQSYTITGQTEVKVVRPHASFGVLTTEPMEGLPIYFQNTSDGSVAWNWDFNNHDLSTMHSPNTVYDTFGWHDVQLVAINEIGCRDTIIRTIYIKPEFYFYAPNAFTPDDDNYNNTYSISVIGAREFDFMIFNRWGDLIYQTSDIYFEWDGTYQGHLVPDDALVYRTKVTDRQGIVHEYFGTIVILR